MSASSPSEKRTAQSPGVRLNKITGVQGLSVEADGLDAIDGAPVLDIKLALSAFLPREPVREPAWDAEIMAAYW